MATRRNGGRDGAGTGEEPSSGRTQRLPRMLVEPSSLEVSIAVFDDGQQPEDATQPTMSRPQLIVMEERLVGLADALAKLGFLVRPAATGVETMSLVAERAPNAVIAGPGDPERRRVLTGALRLRFPQVPVILVLQKVDDAVVDAARREGAHAVLTWPLPQAAEVYAAIPGSPGPRPIFDDVTAPPPARPPGPPAPVRVQSSGSAPKTMVVPPSAALPALPSSMEQRALYSADGSAEDSMTGSMPQARPFIEQRVHTEVSPPRPPTLPAEFMTPLPLPPTPQRPPPPVAHSSPPPDATRTMLQPRIDVSGPAARPAGITRRPPTSSNDDLATLAVARVSVPLTREGDENVETSPGKPAADVQDAIAPRGEIRDVLLAVAPFLWGLDDCARYLEDLHGHHVAGADVHARTVRLVARLLAQLQARVDEL